MNITAVATATNITGSYTFFANGVDLNGVAYSVAGSIVINGAMGTVTSGEQDYFDLTSPTIFASDPITTGSITVGSDGRGTLSLTPTSAPAETFSITVVNNDHILITEFDSGATASGSLDLQTAPTSVPTGGNAFALLDTAGALSLRPARRTTIFRVARISTSRWPLPSLHPTSTVAGQSLLLIRTSVCLRSHIMWWVPKRSA